jgi:uncharacterized protein with ParB-like and HNH nuclease domain
MTESSITLKSINEIIKESFIIPDYQRGYRWTDVQVEDLLQDIWEFSEDTRKKNPVGEYYCLQPVVVTRSGDKWELIDGQQRLTTIFIILTYLDKKKFTLEFATREKSKEALMNLSNGITEDKIDYFYINTAYQTVAKWFEKKEVEDAEGTIKEEFIIALGKLTKIIWYEVKKGDADPVDIFTRLNIGKIALTNAELIKALFLSSENFGVQDSKKTQLRQLEIAGEWDRMEYALQSKEFWFFLSNTQATSSSRIELIFDLLSNKQNSKDENFTFRHFNNLFKANGKPKNELIEDIWAKVKKHFQTFEEWFLDPKLNNYIGYLIAMDVNIIEILALAENSTKSQFQLKLDEKIRSLIKGDITQLSYEDNYHMLVRVLLLFNVLTELKNQDANRRFPFYRFKDNNSKKKFSWSLEHIHAQHSEGLTTKDQWMSWLSEHKKSMERIDPIKYAALIVEINEKLATVNQNDFNDLSLKVLNAFKEDTAGDNIHGIQNMALLDKDTNSSLNCSTFDVKRNLIIERDLAGVFIPVCTRNVFLKYYNRSAKDLYRWTLEDRNLYLKEILTTLEPFLTTNNITIETEA